MNENKQDGPQPFDFDPLPDATEEDVKRANQILQTTNPDLKVKAVLTHGKQITYCVEKTRFKLESLQLIAQTAI